MHFRYPSFADTTLALITWLRNKICNDKKLWLMINSRYASSVIRIKSLWLKTIKTVAEMLQNHFSKKALGNYLEAGVQRERQTPIYAWSELQPLIFKANPSKRRVFDFKYRCYSSIYSWSILPCSKIGVSFLLILNYGFSLNFIDVHVYRFKFSKLAPHWFNYFISFWVLNVLLIIFLANYPMAFAPH